MTISQPHTISGSRQSASAVLKTLEVIEMLADTPTANAVEKEMRAAGMTQREIGQMVACLHKAQRRIAELGSALDRDLGYLIGTLDEAGQPEAPGDQQRLATDRATQRRAPDHVGRGLSCVRGGQPRRPIA